MFKAYSALARNLGKFARPLETLISTRNLLFINSDNAFDCFLSSYGLLNELRYSSFKLTIVFRPAMSCVLKVYVRSPLLDVSAPQ